MLNLALKSCHVASQIRNHHPETAFHQAAAAAATQINYFDCLLLLQIVKQQRLSRIAMHRVPDFIS